MESVAPPPNKNLWGRTLHVLVPKKKILRLYLTVPVKSATSERTFSALRRLERSQELPEKYHEAGPPTQLPTDALSQIDHGHTRHCQDYKEVYEQGKGYFAGKFELGYAYG